MQIQQRFQTYFLRISTLPFTWKKLKSRTNFPYFQFFIMITGHLNQPRKLFIRTGGARPVLSMITNLLILSLIHLYSAFLFCIKIMLHIRQFRKVPITRKNRTPSPPHNTNPSSHLYNVIIAGVWSRRTRKISARGVLTGDNDHLDTSGSCRVPQKSKLVRRKSFLVVMFSQNIRTYLQRARVKNTRHRRFNTYPKGMVFFNCSLPWYLISIQTRSHYLRNNLIQ